MPRATARHPLGAAAAVALLVLCTMRLPHLAYATVPKFKACMSGKATVHARFSGNYFQVRARNFRNDGAQPAAIVVAKSERDVVAAVKCAAAAGFGVCARSGGHSLIGNSLCSGILIDVGNLRFVNWRNSVNARVGAGNTLGELLWKLWHQKRRWFAAGICPGVGVGGYILGGGHGPYEGRLSLACDSLVTVRFVDRFGIVRVASREQHKELFWAMCGGGGGQFGIVVSFNIRTASSAPFDRAVVFRFKWNHGRIGELMSKWQHYNQAGGNVWFRLSMNLARNENGMIGYGACYVVDNVQQCMNRLKQAPFFNTPTRQTLYMAKANNALEVHGFFSRDGGWGRFKAPNLRKALVLQRYVHKGEANGRTYQSTFLTKTKKSQPPSKQFWQTYADFCAYAPQDVPWIECEVNLFNNAIDTPVDNAFAHRGAHIITHYIIGGGSNNARKMLYWRMRSHLQLYTTGVYVNYPEPELPPSKYPSMYWGKNLGRLKKVKKTWDPNLFFLHRQSIPRA